MLSSIKRYEINKNITINKLLAANFQNGGFNSKIESPKMTLNKVIYDDIELLIELPIGDLKNIEFDESINILVKDRKYDIPYQPFYNAVRPFNYLSKVISSYNNEMDMLVQQGIFKEKVKKS